MPHTLSLLLAAVLAAAGTAQPDAPACPQADLIPASAAAGDPDARAVLRACVLADLRRGGWPDADRRLRAARAARTRDAAWQGLVDRLTATRVVDARAWTRVTSLVAPLREASPWMASMVTGLATARLAWRTQDADAFARALDTARALEAEGAAAGDMEIVRAARLVQAAVAGGQYERDEMQLLLEEADAAETALRGTLGDAYVPVVIARELEADLWLQTDRYTVAAKTYEAVIAAHPWRVQPWLGLAEAYRRLGHAGEAAHCLQVAARMAPDFAFESGSGTTPAH